uniref:Uncharacterized protein n=1 Tax=Anopheles albimanus TaxID=7167 RepID=A0A182FX14_ANOAL
MKECTCNCEASRNSKLIFLLCAKRNRIQCDATAIHDIIASHTIDDSIAAQDLCYTDQRIVKKMEITNGESNMHDLFREYSLGEKNIGWK